MQSAWAEHSDQGPSFILPRQLASESTCVTGPITGVAGSSCPRMERPITNGCENFKTFVGLFFKATIHVQKFCLGDESPKNITYHDSKMVFMKIENLLCKNMSTASFISILVGAPWA